MKGIGQEVGNTRHTTEIFFNIIRPLARSLFFNRDGSTDRRHIKEDSGHLVWQADAAMGIWNARQEACVHPDPWSKLHEPRHGGALEVGSRWRHVHFIGDIFNDDISRAVNKVAVEIGGVLLLLLLHFKIPDWRVMPLASRGDGGDADKFTPPVVEEFLLGDIDDDMSRAIHRLTGPVGYPVGQRCRGGSCDNGAIGPQILGCCGVQPTVVGGAGTEEKHGHAGYDSLDELPESPDLLKSFYEQE